MTCYLAATLQALRHPFLVIGYGNVLRSDDAIGPTVADTIAHWNMPHVRSLAVHQLTPELAEDLSQVEYAVFVDACWKVDRQEIQIQSVEPLGLDNSGRSMTHCCSPSLLMALAQSVYGHSPQAWLVEVPAANFSLGDQLSPLAEEGISSALEEIEALIRQYSYVKQTA